MQQGLSAREVRALIHSGTVPLLNRDTRPRPRPLLQFPGLSVNHQRVNHRSDGAKFPWRIFNSRPRPSRPPAIAVDKSCCCLAANLNPLGRQILFISGRNQSAGQFANSRKNLTVSGYRVSSKTESPEDSFSRQLILFSFQIPCFSLL